MCVTVCHGCTEEELRRRDPQRLVAEELGEQRRRRVELVGDGRVLAQKRRLGRSKAGVTFTIYRYTIPLQYTTTYHYISLQYHYSTITVPLQYHYSTVQYSIVQYRTVQYSTVQYSTV